MFINVERYINFIIKNKLTQPQFLMLYLLYKKNYKILNKYKIAFPTEDKSMIGDMMRQDLIDRGFIERVGNKTSSVNDYKITEKFTDLYLKDIYTATQELKDEYPAFAKINGQDIPLVTIDICKLSVIYGEKIDYSVDEHKEIIKDLVYARDKGSIRFSIENFVKGEMWRGIRQSRFKTLSEVKEDFE